MFAFFSEYKDEFTVSKQAISVLTDDINYMNNEHKILSNEPVRVDTMMFKKAGGNDSAHDSSKKMPQFHADYFPFYKAYDRSVKIDKKKREELLESKHDEDT